MPKALIIGAGVAGTTAALALHKAGWESLVCEGYDHSSGLDQGLFLTLAVNGLDALAAVDAAPEVATLGFATGRILFATGTGKELGGMDIGPTLADGTVTRTLRRSELYATLHDLVTRQGIPVAHGRRLVAASITDEGVRARFADGSSAEADVLIGADGLKSTVRNLIDPKAPEPRYTGMGNVGAFTRTAGVRPENGNYRMIWGKRCFFGYTVSPDGEVWWFANPPSRQARTPSEIRELTTDRVKQELLDLFDGDRGPAAGIVASTAGPILIGDQYDMPRVPHWHNQRMVVIGDAAHAVAPSTGQGVSLACEDAVILAQCLRDNAGVGEALARFEDSRRGRVERVVAWGEKMGGTKTMGPVMRVIRDLALPHILAKAGSPAALDRQAWLFHHHIDWDRSPATSAAP